ncbi:MAG: PilZ domain-containing protein [Desulfobacterota bacterium]|nr:PilZ domain-containing protein [Thermodesulfobacteriota bacterium]
MMARERRRHTRVPVTFDVWIRIKRKKIPVTTHNVSMRGMRCSGHALFAADSVCTVEFVLAAGIRFHVSATIVRASATEAALHFTAMDEDAFYHLKRIVQLNAPNADKIDRELATRKKA